MFGIRVGPYEEPGLLNELTDGRMKGDALELTYGDRRIQTESPRFDLIEPRTAAVTGHIVSLKQEYPVVTANDYGAGRAIYVGLPARREIIDPLLDAEIERLSLRKGPNVPSGVMAFPTE